MEKETVRIRYDGPALEDHTIDVNHLAPALLALSDLCTIANEKFNGERSSVRVLVRADLEAKCFDFGIEVAQTIFEQMKTFIKHDEIKSAKEILEYLGVIGGPFMGVLGVLKLLDRNKIASKELITENGNSVVQIKIEGDNNEINISPQTSELLEEPRIISAVNNVVRPLLNDGYESLEFESRGEIQNTINEKEASAIIGRPTEVEEDEIEDEEEPTVMTIRIKVHSSVFDVNSTQWRFDIGNGRVESVDISDTSIAEDTIARGGVLTGDMYKVKMEMTQSTTKNNRIKNRYKILEVLSFTPGKLSEQDNLFAD